MSQISNVLTTTFRATGGNVVSQLNAYGAGFGRLGNKINENTRMSSRLNAQWQAFGTTLRYAIAGGAIFGLTRMLGVVRDINVQLGQMQALSMIGPPGATAFTGTQMDQLFVNLQRTSIDTITPINEVNDAAVNFLSTVQGVKPNELPQMLTDIAQGAKLAQTPMEDLTQAATVMQIAFKRSVNPTTIGQFKRMWIQLIGEAPGAMTAAPTIAQAMPGLASMFMLAPGAGGANVKQAQMMALTLGVLRTGMPPSTAMRGVTYLLQSIAQAPPGSKPAKALADIGITPEFVHSQGVWAATMKLLRTISPVSKGQAAMLGQLPEESNAAPGIPPGELGRLRTMIPRIHGVRAAIILASQLQKHGEVESLSQDLQTMLAVQDENSRQTHQQAQAWEAFRKRARLAEAANAIKTMGVEVAQTFEPIFGFAAQHVLTPVARAAQRHQTATKVAVGGATALIGALAANRFLGGSLFRKIPGLSHLSAGQAYVSEKAITAAMSGATGLGASPTNPLYVTVVGQLFGGGGVGPSPAPGGGGGIFGKIWGGISAGAGYAAGRLGPGALLRAGGALAYLGFVKETAPWTERHITDPILRHTIGGYATTKWSPTGRPYLQGELVKYELSPGEVHKVILAQARKLFGSDVTGFSHYGLEMWHGKADVRITLEQKGQKPKVYHVPVDLWRYPSHRGQAGKTTRGH